MYNSQYLTRCKVCQAPKNIANNIQIRPKINEQTVNKTWTCTLCSMQNSEYIPYCEMCLVPKDVQQDQQMLKELKLKLNTSNPHIKADEFRSIIQKLKDDFERLRNYKNDKQIIIELQQQIDQIYV